MWWPTINSDIELAVGGCNSCVVNSSDPVHKHNPWIRPSKPWTHIHADFAGPFEGSMYLINVCAYT